MNKPIFSFAVASLVLGSAAIVAAQGTHGTGGGGGAGKVSVHDISITKNANTLLAFPGFKGGVFVAAGDVDGDGRSDVITAARSGGPGSFTFSFDGNGPEMGPGNSQSANNLKQLGLGAHSTADTVLISFLRPAGPDKVEEFMICQLSGVHMKRAVLYPRKAGKEGARPMETLSLNYTKIVFHTTPIGAANGGIWKTTNGNTALIGMLLPAVQKVRG